MRQTLLIILLLTATVFVFAQNRSGQGDVRDVYEANCAGCHGDDLAGGSGPTGTTRRTRSHGRSGTASSTWGCRPGATPSAKSRSGRW